MSLIQTVQKITMCKKIVIISITSASGNVLIATPKAVKKNWNNREV